MGGICSCCQEEEIQEYNPDGSPKPLQTKEQMKEDPPDLRRAARDCDLEAMQQLVERMLVKQICSGAEKDEVGDESELGMTALHYSAQANHLRGTVKLILYGADPEACDAKGFTPLHTQMELGYRKVAQFLIKRGANLNAQDSNGATPLMVALLNGHKGLLELALQGSWEQKQKGIPGLDLALVSKRGWSYPLILAKLGWWAELDQVLTMLQDSPNSTASLDVRSESGETLLGWVLRFALSGALPIDNAIPLVTRLLKLGVSATQPAFAESVPPLHLATAIGNMELFNILREAAGEAAISAQDGLNRSLLAYASAKGHLELVQLLLNSLPVDAQDVHKNTPLHLAAMKGRNPKCLKELLEAASALVQPSEGSDLSQVEQVLLQLPNKEGHTVLSLALLAGPLPQAQLAAMECLEKISTPHLQKDANLIAKDVVQDNPLTLAISSHQHAVVKALCERGVDVNERVRGQTPLVRCLGSVQTETAALDAAIFQLLLESGASTEGEGANSPLMAMCKNDCNEFAHLALMVLSERAEGGKLDWNFADPENGRTPLMVAALHNNKYIVRTILQQSDPKRELKACCHAGLRALNYAAWGAASDAMKVLLNHKARPNHKDASGKPVMAFCLRLDMPETLDCAALLLRAGAKPCKHRDAAGEGLLHRAVRYGADDFIRLWAHYGGSLHDQCTSPIQGNIVVPTGRQYDSRIKGALPAVEGATRAVDSVLDNECIPAEPEDEEEEEDEGLDAEGKEKGSLGMEGTNTLELTQTVSMQPQFSSVTQSSVGPASCSGSSFYGTPNYYQTPQIPGTAVAESCEEPEWVGGGVGTGAFACHGLSSFSGPSAAQRRAWARQGSGWWNDWIDQKHETPVTADHPYSNISDEDWHLDACDGLLTMDDILLEVIDRQKAGKSVDAGAVCEGLLEHTKETLRETAAETVSNHVPFAKIKMQDAISKLGIDESLIPQSLDLHTPPVAYALCRALYAKRFQDEGMNTDLDPFYKPESLYYGEPACMQVDVSSYEPHIPVLLEAMFARVASYDIKPDTPLQGADLRERNLRWYLASLSPDALPLKMGRWRTLSAKTEQAVQAARARVAPSAKEAIRKRTAFFGQPDLPTFPELERTTALTYAVQLCRPACVKALLECDAHNTLLNERDVYGHTPLEYGMSMLARDKNNLQLQQIVDLLCIRRPLFTKEAPSEHNPMHPLCVAVLSCDFSRIAWMVCCCGARLDGAWCYAPDVPCHYEGLWESQVGSTAAVLAPLHLALIHRRLDVARLLLDLGADPNASSWGTAAAMVFGKSEFSRRETFLKELMKHRIAALKGKPDPTVEPDGSAIQMREQIRSASQKAMQHKYEELLGMHRSEITQMAIDGKAWLASQHRSIGAAVLGIGTILKGIVDLIKDLLGGPDPWVSALHLAARYGQSDLCVLLLSRGATVNGGVAAQLARRSPFEEALKYARSNYRFDNCGSLRHNWVALESKGLEMIPPMSPAAVSAQMAENMKFVNKYLKNPIVGAAHMAATAAIFAAKVVVKILLDSFKRPIAHYDNALKAAHVLALNHSLMKPYESQTQILLRDMCDNGTWGWLGPRVGQSLIDANWLLRVDQALHDLARDVKLHEAAVTPDPKEYKRIVDNFKRKMNNQYFIHGAKDHQHIHHCELHATLQVLGPRLQYTKQLYSNKAARFYYNACTARDLSRMQGLKAREQARQERAQEAAALQEHACLFEDVSVAESPLQLAGFDLGDEDAFLGGAKDAIGGLFSVQSSSLAHASSRRTSGRSMVANMPANAAPFVVPALVHEPPGSGLGCNTAPALMLYQPTDLHSLFAQVTPEAVMHSKAQAEAAQQQLYSTLQGIKRRNMDSLPSGAARVHAGGAAAQALCKRASKDSESGSDSDTSSIDGSGLEDAFKGRSFEGDPVFEEWSSLQESMSAMNEDAQMDIEGLCAAYEEFQEIVDKIVEITDKVL